MCVYINYMAIYIYMCVCVRASSARRSIALGPCVAREKQGAGEWTRLATSFSLSIPPPFAAMQQGLHIFCSAIQTCRGIQVLCKPQDEADELRMQEYTTELEKVSKQCSPAQSFRSWGPIVSLAMGLTQGANL